MKREKSLTTNHTNKLIVSCSLLIILCSLFFTACQEPSRPEPIPAGMGAFSLRITGLEGRTILPDTDITVNQLETFTLVFVDLDTNEEFPFELTKTSIYDSIYLEPGDYELTVTAFIETGKPVAQGRVDRIEIELNELSVYPVVLRVISNSGQGTFRWNIDFPATVSEVTMIITPYAGGTGATYYFTGTGAVAKDNIADPLSLAAGYYSVLFTLTKPGMLPINRREIMHIYQNMESYFPFTFKDDHFNMINYTENSIIINVPDDEPTLAAALNSIADAGNYSIVINENQTLNQNSFGTNNLISVPVGTDIRLIAQSGEVIISLSESGRIFTLGNGVTLRLRDGITLQGRNDNNNSLVRIENGGTLYLEGTAKITENTGQVLGGGVFVDTGGTFNMIGGVISDNSVIPSIGPHGAGGGVYVNGTFNMSGGIISGNNGGDNGGGGVYVNSGSFNMTAGTISGNTTSAFGGGVYVNTGFTFTMSGGTISGNSAIGNTSFGGGVYIANTATFIKEPPSGGAISGIIYGYDAADPDNPNNNVVRNASNDVLSSRGHAVFFAIMPTARFRDRTANENDTMDTTVAGTPGSWDN